MATGSNSRNKRTKDFRDSFGQLPEKIQKLARAAYKVFLEDPYAPELHNHPLDDMRRSRHKDGSRSVWITRKYRAIYTTVDGTNIWYWIGSHSDYNIFAGRK